MIALLQSRALDALLRLAVWAGLLAPERFPVVQPPPLAPGPKMRAAHAQLTVLQRHEPAKFLLVHGALLGSRLLVGVA